ncbi:transcription factor with AP2 domain(s), putative [Plasmodium relictum]|uniref:Transcription factor with AP2 domain(S), putative n=1 Tax=Plasmodium relictum TaxID=85471 RepID=A0A1J1H5U0_PLARL|nr:transcription factor with AP2 domain(s), putative [Plasmodium relictum]CRH00264.1 transcription factor with AP2 domain(s), putative [Plasmodium relictum]
MTTDLNKRSLRTRRKKTMNSFYYNSDYSNDLNSEESKSRLNFSKKSDTSNKSKDQQRKYHELYNNKELSNSSTMNDLNGDSIITHDKKNECSEENSLNDFNDEDTLRRIKNNKFNEEIINIKNEVKMENSVKLDKSKSYSNVNIPSKSNCNRVKSLPNNNENNYAKMAEKLPHVVGVRFDKSQNRWLSGICINGRCINRYFPVYKYGFEEARRLAIQHRKNFETANLGHLKKQQGESKTSHLNLLNINSQIPNGFKDIQGKNKLIFKYLSYDSVQKEWVVTYDYDNKVLVNKFPIDIYGYNNAYEMAVHCINKLNICNQEKMCKSINKNENGKNIKGDINCMNSQNNLNDQDKCFSMHKDKLSKLINSNSADFLMNNKADSRNEESNNNSSTDYNVDKKHKSLIDIDHLNQVDKSLLNDSKNLFKADSSFLNNDVKILNGIKRLNTNSMSNNDDEDRLLNNKNIKGNTYPYLKKELNESYPMSNDGNLDKLEKEGILSLDNRSFLNESTKNNLIQNSNNYNNFKKCNEESLNVQQLLNCNFINDEDKSAHHLLSNALKHNNISKSLDGFFNSINEESDQKDKKSNYICYNKYKDNNNNSISGIGEEYYDSLNYEGLLNINSKIKNNSANTEEKENFNNKINMLESIDNKEEFKCYETVKKEKENKDFPFNDNKNKETKSNKNNENLNLENILKFKKMIRNILNNNSADNNEKIIKGINILKNMTMNDNLNLINFNKIYNNYSLNNVIKKEGYANNMQKNVKINCEESLNYDEYILVKNEEDDVLNDSEVKKSDQNTSELSITNDEVNANKENIDNVDNFKETNEKNNESDENNNKSNGNEISENFDKLNNNEFNENNNKSNNEFNDIAFKLCPWKKGIQWNHFKNMWVCKIWDSNGNEITKHVYILKKEGIEIGYNYCYNIRRKSFIYYLTKELKKFPNIEEISYDLQYLHFIIEYKDNEKKFFSFEGGIYKSFIECVEYLNKKKREYNENIYDISNFIKEKNNLELDDIYKELDYFQYNKNLLNNICEQTKVAYSIKPWVKGVIWEEKMKKWIVFFKDKNKNLRISFFSPSDYNDDVVLSYNKCCEYFTQIKESNNFDENTEEFSESIRNFIKNFEFDKIIEQNKNDTINEKQKSSYNCFNSIGNSSQNNDDIKTNGENRLEGNIDDSNEKTTFEKNNDLNENNSLKENCQNLSFIENRSYNLSNLEQNKFSSFHLSSEDISLLNCNEKKINSGINGKYSLPKIEESYANESNSLHHNEFYNNLNSIKFEENGKISKENDTQIAQEENKKYFELDENCISKNSRVIDGNSQVAHNEYTSEENSYKIGCSELEKKRKSNINDIGYSNNFYVEEDVNSVPRDIMKEKKYENSLLGGNNDEANNNMDTSNNNSSNSSLLKSSDMPANIAYNKNTENGKVLRNYEKCVNMDNRTINKNSGKMENLLDNNVNIRLPKSEILNQAASLPKLQGMFFDKRRNYWTVSVCGFRKSFGVRTRGVYQAYKLAAEFRNRILETNKGKCYPQKNGSMSGNYKYNLKNNILKEEKGSSINDGNLEDNFKKKNASSGNIGIEKDLYAFNEKRGSFNIKGKVSSNIYDYILDKKNNSITNNNFMKKDIASTANTMNYDDNYGDMEDGKMSFSLKSNKSNEKRSKGNYTQAKYENNIDSNLIHFLNEGDIKDNKNNPFKKNISSSNSAISNTGIATNYSPTHIYEVDNLHGNQDYYAKNEDTKNDLSRIEDYKNKNISPNLYIKNNMNDDNKINLNNVLENDKLYKTTTYMENCNELYSRNLNTSDFDNNNNKSLNDISLMNKLNQQNFEENMNFTYSNNISPSEDYCENNKEDLYKTYNYESENKSYNYNTLIDETIEERDIRINKEVNKCKFVDGLIYDEANKCFRIKINGYRKAYSVIRRGVKEAYKLSIEAIHQIRRQTKMNNYNSENSQINSNNLTHFYNSSSENSRHGSLYNYQHKNKTDINNDCTEDIYDNPNDNNNNNNNNNNKNDCTNENKQNVEESMFPILNVDDKYYDLLKTAIMICLNDILMNSIPKVFQLHKNLNMSDNVKLEDLLNSERKRKEQSLKYHIEYTQNSISISSLIPYLKLFSTEILNNILPSAQSLEIQRLIIHSLDLQAYNTLY